MAEKVFVIGGLSQSLVNFRGDLLKALRDMDLDVTALAGGDDQEVKSYLGKHHIGYRSYYIQNSGLNPLLDLKTLYELLRLFRKHKPHFILAYTIKPVIWGGIAAKLSGTRYFPMITGLGYAFHGQTFKRRLLTKLVVALYRFSLRSAEAVIFQNPDNAELFVAQKIIKRSQCRIVNGSGVNTEKFKPQQFVQPSADKVVFLCVARLLKDKGLREYAEAASLVKKKYPFARFQLIGPKDPSPNGISLNEVKTWDAIEYLGEVSDVRKYIGLSHVYVLPSYHEGVPRSTLEAMSIGRPVVTTNAVGCKETVSEGENGFMVDIGDVSQLVERFEWCILNSHELEAMGQKSVRLVKDRFEVNKVNLSVLNILGLN